MGFPVIIGRWGKRLLGVVVITSALSSCAFLDHVGGVMKQAIGLSDCQTGEPKDGGLAVQTVSGSENGEHVILHTPGRPVGRARGECWWAASNRTTQVASNVSTEANTDAAAGEDIALISADAHNAGQEATMLETNPLENSFDALEDKWKISYLGVQTKRLDDELVQITVRLNGEVKNEDVAEYAECVAAQYTLSRGYGFTRHVLTSVTRDNSIWTGRSVYWVSETLPRGLVTIDAAVTAQSCFENGIPTV